MAKLYSSERSKYGNLTGQIITWPTQINHDINASTNNKFYYNAFENFTTHFTAYMMSAINPPLAQQPTGNDISYNYFLGSSDTDNSSKYYDYAGTNFDGGISWADLKTPPY